MNPYKEEFAVDTQARTLADALKDADVFVGLSQAGLVSQEMVKSMAPRPIVFAMANPDPEITPQDVAAVRPDAITATGRSDYANQVNNVLGFPFHLSRGPRRSGTRDQRSDEAGGGAGPGRVGARRGEAVPEVVRRAYPNENFDFGPEYIIPKPFDSRVLQYVAPAVAQAAMETGVARRPVSISRSTNSAWSKRSANSPTPKPG